MLRTYLTTGIALAVGALASTGAVAQDATKIGVVLPLTGGLAPVGKQVQAGIKQYMDKNGATVAGKKIELIVKDDGGVPDNSKRLAQELIVNDKVAVIGSALTPSAMAVGPLSTQAKTANVVMVSGTSGVINPNNPLHGAHELHARPAVRDHRGMGRQERHQEGRHRAVGLGAGRRGGRRRSPTPSPRPAGRWSRPSRCRSPIPISRRSCSAPAISTPTRCSCSCRRARRGTFAKQFTERGLDKAGIKLIGPGDIVDDNDLPGMGDAMLGVVTAGIYSAAHNSQTNKDYVAAFEKANDYRPNFISLGGYDGMHLIYEALKKTGGKTDAEALVGAMKGHEVGEPARADLDRS